MVKTLKATSKETTALQFESTKNTVFHEQIFKRSPEWMDGRTKRPAIGILRDSRTRSFFSHFFRFLSLRYLFFSHVA